MNNMKKVIFPIVIMIFIVFTAINTSANILYVDNDGTQDYNSIQGAVNNASKGDTIFVFNGTYYENIVINKSIILEGESITNTIIDGGGSSNVIHITTNGVTVTRFTITNSGGAIPNAGINVISDYNTISKNIMINNFYGIMMFDASNNVISNNIITSNNQCGICMIGSPNNIIRENIMEYNTYNGIGIFWTSDNNVITKNIMKNNGYCGINLVVSSENDIRNNTIKDNTVGIHVPAKYENHISDNVISNNNNNIENEILLPFDFEVLVYVAICIIIVLIVIIVLLLYFRKKRK